MKKYFKAFTLIGIILIISGCGKKEVMKTCTLTQTNSTQGYKLENEYKIYGTGKVVDKVVTTETVISDDDEILDYFEEYIDSTYETMNDNYGGYEYTIKKNNNKLITETTIDYNKMNVKKYVEDNSVMKNYVNSDNKLLISGVTQIYELMGASCN